MNSSTMYRLLAGLCLCLLLITALQPAAYARAEALPAADVLLLYDGDNDRLSADDIRRFCDILTSMEKGLIFGDSKTFKNSLEDYEYVIGWRLEEIPEDEMRAVCRYSGNLMIFGSDFMKRYLRETGRSGLIAGESDLDRGTLEYMFSSEAFFEEIVEAENIALFQAEDKGRGVITVNGRDYPFCSRVAGVRFIPVTSLAAELAQAALAQELTDWMWPFDDAPPDYGQYLVLDKIYPFMDAEALLEKIDALIEEGIPYVLSVMPLYKNVSYPAMAQFCQVLQYAQQNGGFIIMHAPIVHSAVRDMDELCQALTDGLAGYLENGVYPLGIEVPDSWMYDDFYLEILRRYSTVFVYEDGADGGFSPDMGYNKLRYNYHQLVMPAIALDKTGASYLTCYSSAVYLDSYLTDAERLRETVAVLKYMRVPFQDLWDLEHSVWGNELHLSCRARLLYLNDKAVKMVYEPGEYDEDYDYNRDIIQRITVSIQSQSRLLLVITIVVVLLFAAFIIYLRRANKRSFFFEDE